MVQVVAMEWFVKNAMATMVSCAPIGHFIALQLNQCSNIFKISDFLCTFFTWGSLEKFDFLEKDSKFTPIILFLFFH